MLSLCSLWSFLIKQRETIGDGTESRPQQILISVKVDLEDEVIDLIEGRGKCDVTTGKGVKHRTAQVLLTTIISTGGV